MPNPMFGVRLFPFIESCMAKKTTTPPSLLDDDTWDAWAKGLQAAVRRVAEARAELAAAHRVLDAVFAAQRHDPHAPQIDYVAPPRAQRPGPVLFGGSAAAVKSREDAVHAACTQEITTHQLVVRLGRGFTRARVLRILHRLRLAKRVERRHAGSSSTWIAL